MTARRFLSITADELLLARGGSGAALALTPHDLDPEQCLIRLREKGETVR